MPTALWPSSLDDSGMIRLHGLDLRYAALLVLGVGDQPLCLDEIVADIEALGFLTATSPNPAMGPTKPLADALRWEIRRGRVRRVARGMYAAGPIDRSTRYRARVRLAHLTGRSRDLTPGG